MITFYETATVLTEEANAIHGARAVPEGLRESALYNKLNQQDSAALCLSGGGIRSASFGLGVIQALAACNTAPEKPADSQNCMLRKFHFLSTVSGGGYIGGWLSGWIAREEWPNVWERLVGRPGGPDIEPSQLSWLRDYSSYLTPQVGLNSADTWSAAAIVVRNLMLNWLVIIPTLGIGVLLLKWFAGFAEVLSKFSADSAEHFLIGTVILGCGCLIFALQFAVRNRPALGNSSADQGRFLAFDLLPTLIAMVCFAFALAIPETNDVFRKLSVCTDSSELASHSCLITLAGLHAIGGVLIYAIGWCAGTLICSQKKIRWICVGDLLAWAAGGVVYGALVGCGVWFFLNELEHTHFINIASLKSAEIVLLVGAIPWGVASQLIGEMIFVGLSSREKNSDSDREWFGRSAGWYVALAAVWLITAILVFVGFDLVQAALGHVRVWLAGVGGVSGLVTALLGKSSATPRKGKPSGFTGISANFVLAVAAPVFAAVLLILISVIIDQFAFGMSLTQTAFWNAPVLAPGQPFVFPSESYWLLLWTFIIVVVCGLAGWAVNVNRFSLHALYRNRIIRAFLGGSRSRREPNKFTDFDPADNLRMADLWRRDAGASVSWRPFHVINMALNIVSTKKLAWQQRKAESFVCTPLHTGSACLNPDANDIRVGGYRDSKAYGDREGISLGTAVAISGAAASSSMGYHSSAPLSFLMTLLNARLGWWLSNPGPQGGSDEDVKLDGPKLAWRPLFDEMLGLTTDDKPYIYLSDGGHFENLALYEMVRRRCRFIVLSDAGCDPNFEFEDLGNAVRKISIDLGVTVDFPKLTLLKNRAEDHKPNPPSPTFYTIGTIDYSADGKDSKPGMILYIKPFYRDKAIMDVGVRNYAIANKTFPHQDTNNQWFDEPQFESYRRLGFEITTTILGMATDAMAGEIIQLEGALGKLAQLQT